jgi:hypothetical protein
MVKINWRVEGLPLLIDENNNIWRDKFISNKRYYDYKQLDFHIHQGNEYLLVNRKRYSKTQIINKLYRVNEFINVNLKNEDLLF